MRYVGRHRALRPLLLRRPIIGGVAIGVLLLPAAALAASGKGPIGPGSGTKHSPGALAQSSAPAVVPTSPLTDGAVPITETTNAASAPTASYVDPTTTGLPLPITTTTGGSYLPPPYAVPTTTPGRGGSVPTTTTPKPAKTTKKPAPQPTTKKPTPKPTPTPTTKKPTIKPTVPPTTKPPTPTPTPVDPDPPADPGTGE